MEDFYQGKMKRLEELIGYRPNVILVKDLYEFEGEHHELYKDEDRYHVFWTYMDEAKWLSFLFKRGGDKAQTIACCRDVNGNHLPMDTLCAEPVFRH